MKQRILNIAKVSLFLLMAISVMIPRAADISFCNPMEQVMLQSCCHPQKVEVKNGEDSVSGPDCCDKIALPDAEKDALSIIILPKPLVTSAWFILPTPEWILLEDTEETPIVKARGPPPDPIPLFIQNCSYLI